jgi:hypothetical protein
MRREAEPATVRVRVRTAAATVLAAALLGAGARGLVTAAPAAPRALVSRSPSLEPGPRVDGPIPSGFARSRAGAVAAATTDIRQGQRLFEMSPAARLAALRDMASPAAASAYVATQSEQLAELDGIAARGTGPLTWDVAVVATRLDAYTPNRSLVTIWRVGILSITGLTAPLAEWTTDAYELVWQAGDWRIWSETQTPGPTPLGHPSEQPSTPEQLRLALAGFTRYPGPDAF